MTTTMMTVTFDFRLDLREGHSNSDALWYRLHLTVLGLPSSTLPVKLFRIKWAVAIVTAANEYRNRSKIKVEKGKS